MKMKKIFYYAMSVLLSAMMLTGCSNDDVIDGSEILTDSLAERLKSIPESDYTGCLNYEQYTNLWAISYYLPGSIDWGDVYYPLNLPDEYKVKKEEGINVSFSGKIVEMTDDDIKSLKIPLMGGTHYYFVYLTKIQIEK